MPRNDLIEYRQGTTSAWSSTNPTMGLGEPGFETDTFRRKLGDGVTAWTSLPYETQSTVFNVCGYGARPDGNTGGTTGTDNTTYIQNAINAASSYGGIVWFPPGTYRHTAQINLYPNVTLLGSGAWTTFLTSDHTGSGIVSTGTVNGSTLGNTLVAHLGLVNNNSGNTGVGYNDNFNTRVFMDDVMVTGYYYSAALNQTEYANINRCHFRFPLQHGLWLVNSASSLPNSGSAAGGFTNGISVDNTIFNSCPGFCIIDDGGENHKFSDCGFEEGGQVMRVCGLHDGRLNMPYMEGQSGTPIVFSNTTSTGYSGYAGSLLYIDGGVIQSATGTVVGPGGGAEYDNMISVNNAFISLYSSSDYFLEAPSTFLTYQESFNAIGGSGSIWGPG